MGEMVEDRLDFDLIVGFKVPLSEAGEKLAPYGATVEVLPRGGAAEPSNELPESSGVSELAEAPEALELAEAPALAQMAEPSEAPPLPSEMPVSEQERMLAEALSAAGIAAPEAVEGPKEPPPPQFESKPIPPVPDSAKAVGELRSLTKTVRVDLPKLDQLMNMVGELVLTKGRLMALNDRLSARMGFTGEALELAKAQKELERRLALLQEAVMDVRMVPMGQLFSKLHRVIRKIIRSTDKQIDLQIIGAETQLDKLIVEDISDPLIHVIRNAVDHGVEGPDERELKGKPRDGRVSVSAQQRGNYVVIAVSDDGAGIDPERVRAKAIKKGLLAETDHPDKKQLFDLLFLPGFSTRDAVTEISGRGVGMDVLRKNIANLSGIIEMDSEVGRGTTVKIILPITLAIIQALLVESGPEVYAIPLSSVLETVVISPESIRSLEGKPVLKIREQTLPLVRLSTIFEQDEEAADEPVYAVIVGIAEKRVAFAVDDLVSQRDVVIKTLGNHLQGLKGICGATDLGDQRTVLILDVAELIEEVFHAV
jgi:two-component system chemotaxis sensor kinase CheA